MQVFSSHLCGLLVKVLQETLSCVTFFNVLESGHKNGKDEESCGESFTCDLEQINQMKRLYSDPSPSPQPESMQPHLGRCTESVTSVLLFLKGCLHK